jgi:RNA polymerase sigma-70 factor (ECF subfamily)
LYSPLYHLFHNDFPGLFNALVFDRESLQILLNLSDYRSLRLAGSSEYFRHRANQQNTYPFLLICRTVTIAPNPEFEAECIRRIQAGEKQVFHDLIHPCERAIYFLLLSLLGNEADAEDAAQETVIKVYRNLHLFRGESQFRTWVLSIARNEGLGRLRKLRNRREDSLDAGTDEQTGDYTPAILTSWREIPTEALERKELGDLLRTAVAALPEIYRNVILLRDIEEMDVRETSVALGITEGAVKVRLHRARALLQKSLAPKLKGFAPKRKGLFGWGT